MLKRDNSLNAYNLHLPEGDFRIDLINGINNQPSSISNRLRRKLTFNQHNNNTPNNNQLLKLLKKLIYFNIFLSYNSISDEQLLNAIPLMKWKQINAEGYLFKQNNPCENFICVIKGSIKITKTFQKNKKSLIKEDDEKEIGKLTQGSCYGEFELWNNLNNEYNGYIEEDSIILYMEKDDFKIVFGKAITKAEVNRRAFIKKTIPSLQELQESQFENYYMKSIKPKFYKRNELIYTPKLKTGFLYVLYQGECSISIPSNQCYSPIIPDNFKGNKINYTKIINDIQSNKIEDISSINQPIDKTTLTLYKHLLNLLPGAVCGLEINSGLLNLRHTCICTSENCCFLVINLLHFPQNVITDILQSMLGIYVEMEKQIYESYLKQKSKLKTLNFKKKINLKLKPLEKIQYNKEYFDITREGFIKQNKKNIGTVKEYYKYLDSESKLKHNDIPLSDTINYVFKVKKLRERSVGDSTTNQTFKKITDVNYTPKSLKFINSYFKEKKKSRNPNIVTNLNKLMLNSNSSIYRTLSPSISSRKTTFCNDHSVKTIKKKEKNIDKYNEQKPFPLNRFNSGIFVLPIISLG
jgi:CRP-like cAMP-binding protein